MSLKLRGVLVVVVGTVLGLVVAISGQLLAAVGRTPGAATSLERHHKQSSAELIAQVIERIEEEYVDQIDEEQLVESAIRGILTGLDSHSRFLDPEAYEELRISSTGTYSGIGLDVAVRDGQVTVVSPIEGAPADAAGILPGDIVTAVNDQLVDEKNFERTVGTMRGAPGTAVRLDVRRAGISEALRFELMRETIRVRTVNSAYLGNGVGYVRLTGFSESTAQDLDSAAAELRSRAEGELRGMVLDLRNNPGGLLDAAVSVADRFLDRGLIVRGAGRILQSRFEEFAQQGDALEDVPLVVLVNGGSASASEIVAGAIKDHSRARLVGERTYGKGSVQTVMPLGENSAIKLTTSRYLTPSGFSINGTGIEPDILIRNAEPQRQFRGRQTSVSVREDTQLARAVRVLGFEPLELSQVD